MHPSTYTHQPVIHIVSTPIRIRGLNSPSVGSDHTGQPSIPTCITEHLLPITLLLFQHCSFRGPFLIDTDHCSLATAHKNRSIENVLTQFSIITSYSLSNLMISLDWRVYPPSKQINLENKY
ncbi:hypothetical protein CHARACLAT_032766 [Characodon lateralis]|uniref:Uncharacterized protein n=1 Tax=Characodon lateralis TaxID=208331 RepID=A0ABU7DZI7_9TELE|nr:hypothetical protein [Characodon lateralis]